MIRRPNRRYNLSPTRRATAARVTVAPGASNRLARRTPIAVTTSNRVLSTKVIVFDQPVILKGVPQYTVAGNLPTAAVRGPENTVTLTYAAAPIDPVVIPFEDPAVRNSAAGYVLAGTYADPEIV